MVHVISGVLNFERLSYGDYPKMMVTQEIIEQKTPTCQRIFEVLLKRW